ncbi:outer membrane lipoprotein carrier protein LolA [Urechidicola sp. KH5]
MKKTSVLIALLITALGFSQDAKTLLDKVAQTAKSYDNIYIEFEHKIDNEIADIHQSTNGKVTLKSDLYNFEYMGVQQMFDGAKVYLMVHEDEEVVIKQPNNEDDASTLTPSKMLTFYKKGFNYSMDIKQTITGKKLQFVKLTPTSEETELKHVLVGIDTKTNHIYRVIETGLDDTVTTYTLTTFKTNQTLDAATFIFDRAAYEEKGYSISEPK